MGLKTSIGLTALHNAATNGHADVIAVLLKAGASPNARALSNATAIFCAAGAGFTQVRCFGGQQRDDSRFLSRIRA